MTRLRRPAAPSAADLGVLVALTLLLAGVAFLRAGPLAALQVVLVGGAVAAATNSWRQRSRSHRDDLAAQHHRDRRRFEAMVRHASDVLIVLDARGRVTWASRSAAALLGADPVGRTRDELVEELHEDERDATLGALLERLALSDGQPIRLGARLRDRDGRQRHIDLVAVDLSDDPDVAGVVLTIRDTTERAVLEAELRRLAFTDTLTGLANRDLFTQRLEHALQRARRTGRPVAVLLCDLDDFKDVNDTLGHPAGDALLHEVGRRFAAVVRATDTVARLGGDEFAVVCEDLDAGRDAVVSARRLLAATEEPILIDGHELRVGLSVGIAVDDGQRSGEELLRDADVALYEAKAEGKHRWALHRLAMTTKARERLQLTGELGTAIAAGDIQLVYQPIVALRPVDGHRRTVGVEALARWTHPHRGRIAAEEFVALAERGGLIRDLGDLVLDRALRDLATWSRAHPGTVLRMGVNVSAQELRDRKLVDRTAELLTTHDVRPDRLILEVTESVMLEDAGHALDVMRELRRMGVRFAIDDFGTGYSSLSYLRRLPTDIVKIDRSFVQSMSGDPAAQDLVRAIVDLSHTLHKDVVAEGVETADQRDLLVDMGCDFAQGYLFARPLVADAIERSLGGPSAHVVREPTGRALRPVRDEPQPAPGIAAL